MVGWHWLTSNVFIYKYVLQICSFFLPLSFSLPCLFSISVSHSPSFTLHSHLPPHSLLFILFPFHSLTSFLCPAISFLLHPLYLFSLLLLFILPPVPPVITSYPPSFYEIRGNQPFTLTVEFQSRFRENTTVTWYLNGSTLPEGRVQTQYSSKLDGRTILQLDPITRNDKGVYEVMVRNSFGIIPLQMSENETSFQVSIIGKWCIKVLAQWGTSV